MPRFAPLVLPIVALPLAGCVSTVASVVTAPVKVVSKAADWATTSQDEADRNRGRKLREREEALGRLARDYQRQDNRCREGNDRACARASEIEAEMRALERTPV